jgi:GntR family transcriptional regulator, trigonelline degradation regulator
MAKRQSTGALRVAKDMPSLRELTTRTLRDAILRMHFKPKQRLTERELCEQTGVSRTCVREAVRSLEAEGLVERVPNRGIFVASVSVDEARQIYEVRAELEPAFAKLFVARAEDRELQDLRSAYLRIEKVATRRPVISYVEAIDQFYDVILRGARNEVARTILQSLRARMRYLRTLTAEVAETNRKQESLALMRKIMEAALRRDAGAVAERCRAFVERSAKFAIVVLSRQETATG